MAQSILYVTPSGAGSGDGSSWGNAIASQHFAQRLTLAPAGVQFWLAGGLYKPTTTNNRTISFAIPSGVQVYGGFVGNETVLTDRPLTSPSSTSLSGDIGLEGDTNDNSYHVVRFYNVNNQTRLERVVITAGYANGPVGSISDADGAGVINTARYSGSRSDPVLRECYFINNVASYYGGAIHNSGDLQAETNLATLDCQFFSNTGYGGGAIYNEGSSTGRVRLQVTNCTFRANRATYFGGAVSSYIRDASFNQATFHNCLFAGNVAGWYGGAIHNENVSNSTFQIAVNNSLFIDNSCRYGGGGINNTSTGALLSIRVSNSTFSRNTLIDGLGAAMRNHSHSAQWLTRAVIQNCIIWGNSSGIQDAANALTSATYSDLQDRPDSLSAPSGNRSINPNFLDATNHDFRLNNASPLVNAGDPASTTATAGSNDLAGINRISGSRIDMGAYEAQSFPCSDGVFTVQSGRWDDVATWSCNRLPTATDVVSVKHTITIPANYTATARQVIYEQPVRIKWETGSRLLLSR